MDCAFCGIENNAKPKFPFLTNLNENFPIKERILLESKNFFIKLDLAPITDYHFLLSPKEHYKSCYSININYKPEFAILKKRISQFYEKELNMICVFFEHGMSNNNCDNSCIEHAHLHSIPFPKNSIALFKKFILNQLPKENYKPKINSDYLYISMQDKTYYWSSKDKEPQQLRKLIAEFLGAKNRSKWQYCLTDKEQLNVSLDKLKNSKKINKI